MRFVRDGSGELAVGELDDDLRRVDYPVEVLAELLVDRVVLDVVVAVLGGVEFDDKGVRDVGLGRVSFVQSKSKIGTSRTFIFSGEISIPPRILLMYGLFVMGCRQFFFSSNRRFEACNQDIWR